MRLAGSMLVYMFKGPIRGDPKVTSKFVVYTVNTAKAIQIAIKLEIRYQSKSYGSIYIYIYWQQSDLKIIRD